MLRTLGVLFVGITPIAACTAAGTSPAASSPASPVALPSTNASTIPFLQPTPPATTEPTPHPTPAPTLPAGTAAPPPPRGLTATARQEPCPDETGFREFVLAAEIAGTGPGCVVVDLGWVPGPGADAVYRIYMTWSGEGAKAACVPAEGHVIATSAPNALAITVGPLDNTTGGGQRCLYVAAANSVGESARVKFTGDFVTPGSAQA